MPYYESYEDMLEANVGACNIEDHEDCYELINWLLNEAYHKEKTLQLLTKRAKERFDIDLEDLITVKDLLNIPMVALEYKTPFEDCANHDDCDECEHYEECKALLEEDNSQA